MIYNRTKGDVYMYNHTNINIRPEDDVAVRVEKSAGPDKVTLSLSSVVMNSAGEKDLVSMQDFVLNMPIELCQKIVDELTVAIIDNNKQKGTE